MGHGYTLAQSAHKAINQVGNFELDTWLILVRFYFYTQLPFSILCAMLSLGCHSQQCLIISGRSGYSKI